MTLTPKQEAFAKAYLETSNASEAYRRAYDAGRMTDKQIHEEACKLRGHPKVSQRVEQLQQRHAKRHDITLDRLTEMLLEDRSIAHKAKKHCVEAVMGLAKLHGLVIDKTRNEHSGPNGEPLAPVINVTVGRAQSSPAR